ncbi:MAG TPA: Imm63 family immunity protein [Spirochaetota bacterium]|nr:Imm63 family immunity protein [Spirochaetota bacterium]HQE60287.1 Imm63 family immunity protein [Spirochaetota bacterium]
MNYLNLKEIADEVNNLARKIKAPKNTLPTYGHTIDGAHPHIEVDQYGYHYFVIERGQELKRKTTQNIHELLYWIFESISFSMAIEFELVNRIDDQDSRRIGFKKQEELLGILNLDWEEKQKNDHLNILKDYPFDDFAGLRATLSGELRKKGLSENEINKLVYEKYPKIK